MSLPQTIPSDKIAKLDAQVLARFERASDKETLRKRLAERRVMQERFLASFSHIGNARVVCRGLGIPESTVAGWKSTDPEFCRGYNAALEHMREHLADVVWGRAIGYRPYDEDGNPAADADGKPIYEKGSDVLAMKLLEMDRKSEPLDNVFSLEIVSRENRTDVQERQIDGEIVPPEDNMETMPFL